ncbi:hypothetical protein quinque_008918 [Culex quinquefasciatus]
MARADIGTIAKFAIPRMLMFFVTVVLYFTLIGKTERSTVTSTILKCLPIVTLWMFVLMSDFELKRSHRYQLLILAGLVASCAGDLLLNYDLFEAGMGAFGVAQIFYVSAFGFRPLRPWVGLPLYGFAIAAVAIMFHNLPTLIKICLPIYGALLVTMCWRSLARIDCFKNILRFYTPVANAQTAIMVTYYVAQFGIALSVIEQSVTASGGAAAPKTANSSKKRQNGTKQKKSA